MYDCCDVSSHRGSQTEMASLTKQSQTGYKSAETPSTGRAAGGVVINAGQDDEVVSFCLLVGDDIF